MRIAAATAALLILGASGAQAGEITGGGTPITVKANSICAYSGQNDGYHDGTETARVQSFGQGVKEFAAVGMVDDFAHELGGVGIPGEECNGHLNPWPPSP